MIDSLFEFIDWYRCDIPLQAGVGEPSNWTSLSGTEACFVYGVTAQGSRATGGNTCITRVRTGDTEVQDSVYPCSLRAWCRRKNLGRNFRAV